MSLATPHPESPTLAERRLAKVEKPSQSALLEQVLIKGDLANLTADERNQYYLRVCESAGLNPLTKPLEYIKLNNRLVLYALRSCTDQLRAIHGVSVIDMDDETRDGVLIVTVKVQDKNGRTDMAKGAVSLTSLKGEALANAIMKAETKAKRRATLSICGLGLLDETEVETIPGAAIPPAQDAADGTPVPPPHQPQKVLNPKTGRMINPNSAHQLNKSGAWLSFEDKLQHYRDVGDLDGLKAWFAGDEVTDRIAKWPQEWRELAQEAFDRAHDEIEKAERG